MAKNCRTLNMTQQAITAYANAIRYEYPDTLMYLHYAQMFPHLRNDSTLYFSSDRHPAWGDWISSKR
jgi:hypothetical protein